MNRYTWKKKKPKSKRQKVHEFLSSDKGKRMQWLQSRERAQDSILHCSNILKDPNSTASQKERAEHQLELLNKVDWDNQPNVKKRKELDIPSTIERIQA